MWYKMEGVICWGEVRGGGGREGSEFEQVIWTFDHVLNMLKGGT